jgi:hypothetical protein
MQIGLHETEIVYERSRARERNQLFYLLLQIPSQSSTRLAVVPHSESQCLLTQQNPECLGLYMARTRSFAW